MPAGRPSKYDPAWPANPQPPYWRERASSKSESGAHSHDIVSNMIQTAEDAGVDPAPLF